MLHDVFLSYAREDVHHAEQYVKFFEQNGLSVWWDQKAGEKESVYSEIDGAIRSSNYLFLLWSRHASSSNFVAREVAFAETVGCQIVPIKLDNRGFSAGVGVILAGSRPINARTSFPTNELIEIVDRIKLQPRDILCRSFVFLNMKGGVGKTTLAANVAAAIHSPLNGGDPKNVLLIDLDPQANLSNQLLDARKYEALIARDKAIVSCFEQSLASGGQTSPTVSLFDIDTGGAPPPPHRLAHSLTNPLKTARLDLVPGQFELFKYALTKNAGHAQECGHRFAHFVTEARRTYDAVIIDAAPSNSFITECALRNASHIVAPASPDKYSLRGIQAVQRLMEDGYRIDPPLPLWVLRNQVEANSTPAEAAIVDAYPDDILPERIRQSNYFKVSNPNPNDRIRNPLEPLAYYRGNTQTKQALDRVARQILG